MAALEACRLLLATGNPHKLVELRRALPGWEIELVETVGSPIEDGETYEDNARLKALHGRARAPSGSWVAGEDSGIEATALGGRPGIESARWAEDGVAAMLAALDGTELREARYECVIVAVSPEGDEVVARGALDGSIAASARGSEGFGYDPIFVPVGETRTVAELGDAWKQANSHRARAAAQLAEALRLRQRLGIETGTARRAE
jgi:XTP/dITP diphosphohydrolase